jgi:hypothetical protein
MKELRSLKTGLKTVYTEEEYADIVNNQPEWLSRFEVTDIRSRPIIPSLKEVPAEIKVKTIKTHK